MFRHDGWRPWIIFVVQKRFGDVRFLGCKTKAGPPALDSPEVLIAWFG
jgi:hypothetical protein